MRIYSVLIETYRGGEKGRKTYVLCGRRECIILDRERREEGEGERGRGRGRKRL